MTDSNGETKKRQNGYGCVFQRGDGRWVAQFNGRDALGFGKRRQVYAQAEEEAWEKLNAELPAEKKGLTMLQLEPEKPLFDPENQHVYLIQCVGGGPIKIGLAQDVSRRLTAIQSCCPYPLRVLFVIEYGGREIETQLHRNLTWAGLRLHCEWFADSPRVLAAAQRMTEIDEQSERSWR